MTKYWTESRHSSRSSIDGMYVEDYWKLGMMSHFSSFHCVRRCLVSYSYFNNCCWINVNGIPRRPPGLGACLRRGPPWATAKEVTQSGEEKVCFFHPPVLYAQLGIKRNWKICTRLYTTLYSAYKNDGELHWWFSRAAAVAHSFSDKVIPTTEPLSMMMIPTLSMKTVITLPLHLHQD